LAIDFRVILGVAGVPPHDDQRAYEWEHKLHWLMLLVSLLAIPAYYLEELTASPLLHRVGVVVDVFILVAFSMELMLMLRITRQKQLYLIYNWVDVFIIIGSAAAFLGAGTEWVAAIRLLRLAVVGMMLLRMVTSVRRLFSPDGLPYIFAFGMITMLVGGAIFYLVEPTISSLGEGVWLAFTTAATVGYGDLVPTTPISRVFSVFLVLVGYSMIGALTGSIASILIGADEKRLRREMHRDIQSLRSEVSQLREDIRTLAAVLGEDNLPAPTKKHHPRSIEKDER
jgi:voltage-gated potassium channel